MELPELSDGDLTPLILGDWLEVVKPLMMDLSPQASRWWVLVVEESYKYYNEWRRATPMERLRISPESVVVKMDPTLHRTEQRGISLLLKAIPSAVKETVIAERLLSTTGILFTLLKNFQPGGSSERTLLLKELSEIKVGKSPNDACAAVRSWRRFYTRTKEIEATVPDPIILLRALEPAVQLVSQLDAQATFRLAQSRAQLQVDARPEELTVWKYSECLLAELESLRLVQGSLASLKPGTPTVKALQQQDGGAPQRSSDAGHARRSWYMQKLGYNTRLSIWESMPILPSSASRSAGSLLELFQYFTQKDGMYSQKWRMTGPPARGSDR